MSFMKLEPGEKSFEEKLDTPQKRLGFIVLVGIWKLISVLVANSVG